MRFIILFDLLVFMSASFYAQTYVPNTDFSKYDLHTGQVYKWNSRPLLCGWRVEHPEGKQSYVLALFSLEEGKEAVFTSFLENIETGTKYTLKARVKVPSGQLFRIYVESASPAWKSFNANWIKGNGTWQDISFKFEYKVIEAAPYVVFGTKGKKKAILESLVIAEE